MKRINVVAILTLAGLAAIQGSASAQREPIVPPAPAELQQRKTNIVIRLAEDGTPAINHQAIPWNRLAAELKAVYAERPEKILFIETTPRDKVEDVRRILAVAKKQGIQLYALFGA